MAYNVKPAAYEASLVASLRRLSGFLVSLKQWMILGFKIGGYQWITATEKWFDYSEGWPSVKIARKSFDVPPEYDQGDDSRQLEMTISIGTQWHYSPKSGGRPCVIMGI